MPPNRPVSSPKAHPHPPVWTPDALRLPLEQPPSGERRDRADPERDDTTRDRARRDRGRGGVVVIDMNDYTVVTWT